MCTTLLHYKDPPLFMRSELYCVVFSMVFAENEFAELLTGKSLSEALIFASTNPQYDDRLFIVHENCKLRIPAEHVVYTSCCFCFDIQDNFGTQHVLQMLRASEIEFPCNVHCA